MISKLLMAGVLAASLAASVHAQPAAGPGDTRAFIVKASQSDEFERREGRLAQTRATDPAVRRFAGYMVSQHTMTTQNLKAAIRRAGQVPPPPPPLSAQQSQMMADLAARHGPDFDRTYVRQQVKAHEQALDVVRGYAQSGPPGPIRQAARQTLPIIRHHLTMAIGLQGRVPA